jgi:hypothetical protein
MRKKLCLVWLLVIFTSWHALDATDSHRVVVVSATDNRRSSDPCEVRLIEVESARTLAKVEAGATAEAALSVSGDLLAVISQFSIAGIGERRKRLELYRTEDLSPLKRGYLPVWTGAYKRAPSTVQTQFSPDGSELVVQQMVSHDAVLSRVRLELDEAGVFHAVGQPLTISGARGVQFLRVHDWPKLTVWGGADGLLRVLDLETGSQLSQTRLDALADVPAELPRRHWTGTVVTSDGKYGYYVPQQWGRPSEGRHVGHLQRIDLRVNPPKVIDFSEQPQANLSAQNSAASETAGIVAVAERKYSDLGPVLAPSSHIRIFHSLPLKPQREIDLSLSNCDSLTISRDGNYLYAVDFEKGGMAVVEISAGREVTVIQDVGAHPALVFALP